MVCVDILVPTRIAEVPSINVVTEFIYLVFLQMPTIVYARFIYRIVR